MLSIKVYLVLLVVLSVICNITAKEWNLQHCKNDLECPKQQFCYQERLCADCIDCTTYNKQQVTCAKTPEECGGCNKGYGYKPEDERLDGKPPKFCIMQVISAETVNTTAINANEDTDNSTLIIICVTASIAFAVFFVVLGYVIVRRYGRSTTNHYKIAAQSEGGIENPTAPINQTLENVICSKEVFPQTHKDAYHVSATPFRTPFYIGRPDPDQMPENNATDENRTLLVENSGDAISTDPSNSDPSSIRSQNLQNNNSTVSCKNCSQNRQSQSGSNPSVNQFSNSNILDNQQSVVVKNVIYISGDPSNLFNSSNFSAQNNMQNDLVTLGLDQVPNLSNITIIPCNLITNTSTIDALVPSENHVIALLDNEH